MLNMVQPAGHGAAPNGQGSAGPATVVNGANNGQAAAAAAGVSAAAAAPTYHHPGSVGHQG